MVIIKTNNSDTNNNDTSNNYNDVYNSKRDYANEAESAAADDDDVLK